MAKDIQAAALTLRAGGLVAYPTEAVYGIGCDPNHEQAVTRLAALKKRPLSQGFILIGASWEQLAPFSEPLSSEQLATLQATWPGPVTWCVPASDACPSWVRGEHPTVALRVTDHPLASALCQAFGGAIVSTSANFSGEAPCRTVQSVESTFSHALDGILPGDCGPLSAPTPIWDLITGKTLRGT